MLLKVTVLSLYKRHPDQEGAGVEEETNTSWYFYKPFLHSNKQWGEVKVSESINENVNPTSL